MTSNTLPVINFSLGPLTAEQRRTIMRLAAPLSADGRRLFRRLLILAQPRGLTPEAIERAAAQARAHFEAETVAA
jgi:hypothetical protein